MQVGLTAGWAVMMWFGAPGTSYRQRKVTFWLRVQISAAPKTVSETPLVMPFSAAQVTASV